MFACPQLLSCLSLVAARVLRTHIYRTRHLATVLCLIHRAISAISHHILVEVAQTISRLVLVIRHTWRHRCHHQIAPVIICTVRWVPSIWIYFDFRGTQWEPISILPLVRPTIHRMMAQTPLPKSILKHRWSVRSKINSVDALKTAWVSIKPKWKR